MVCKKVLMMLSMAVAVASGEWYDRSGKNDRATRMLEEWKVDKDEVKLKAKTKTSVFEDKLDFQIKTQGNDGIETEFKYLVKEKGGVKGKFDMRMKIFKLIEFKDSGPDGWDPDDVVVQEFVLGYDKTPNGITTGEKWSPIVQGEADSADDGLREFVASTEKGTFKVIGRYAGKPVSFTRNMASGVGKNNVTLTYDLEPNAIKFDYIVTAFPFINSDSKLALDGRFKTKAKVKTRSGKSNVVDTPAEDGMSGASFTWATSVQADGSDTPVKHFMKDATQQDEDEEVSKSSGAEKNQRVVWTFQKVGQTNTFIWDPELLCHTEAYSSAVTQGMSSFVIISCILATIWGSN